MESSPIKLKFGFGNSKLSNSITTFSIPAGYTCPFAKECHSKANRLTGKVVDGKHCQFRCFAASQEALYSNVRKQRWYNFELLKENKTVENIGQLIQSSIPNNTSIIRIHVSGDYFSETYFLAWLNVAINNPRIIFYGYTKALPYLVKYKKVIPSNFRLTASKGGTHDHLIKKHNLKFAEVVFSESEAQDKDLCIDHDDGLAIYGDKSFALLLHSTQPAGTPAAKAWENIRRNGIGGYSKDKVRGTTVVTIPFKIHVTDKNYIKYNFNNKQSASK